MSSNTVLEAVRQFQRSGPQRLSDDLERREPELTEHILEGLSQLHRGLLNAGLSGRTARSLYRQAEALVLTCVHAIERSQDSP